MEARTIEAKLKPITERLERTLQILSDADIEINNSNDLVIRSVDEYYIIKEYRALKQKQLMEAAQKVIAPFEKNSPL